MVRDELLPATSNKRIGIWKAMAHSAKQRPKNRSMDQGSVAAGMSVARGSGGSIASSTMPGNWTDFDFGMAAFRYARTLWSGGAFARDWTIDAVPLALIALDRGGEPDKANGTKDVVYGAGIAPIGLSSSRPRTDPGFIETADRRRPASSVPHGTSR